MGPSLRLLSHWQYLQQTNLNTDLTRENMNFCFAKYSFLLTEYLSMLLLLLEMPETQAPKFSWYRKARKYNLVSFSRFTVLSNTLPDKTIHHKNNLHWNNANKLWGEQFMMPTQRIPWESKRQPLCWRNKHWQFLTFAMCYFLGFYICICKGWTKSDASSD